MKILVIDRDQMTAQMVSNRLAAEGHEVVVEAIKNEGLERVEKEVFDVVFIDPSPMRDARAMALNIRRSAKKYPHIIFMTADEGVTANEVMQMGCNDFVRKPFDQQDIKLKIENAQRLRDLFKNLGDTSEDFPSAGGIISKSAFNQIFLSAMDRAGRYNESSFIISISISNYKDIKTHDGAYFADYAVSKLAKHMVYLRRQSDIIGQTASEQYSIWLQTKDKKEAIDAAKRFAVALEEMSDFQPSDGRDINIYISLTHLPTGKSDFDHMIVKKIKNAA